MRTIYSFVKKLYYFFERKKKERYINNLIENGLVLGRNVSIIEDFFFDPSHCFLISIGDNVTICPNVRLITHDASTKKLLGYTKIGKITIGENCFIGDSAIILPNVRIGVNSIVGAGSIVTKNIPAGTVVAGNPAKVICTMNEYRNKIEKISKQKKVFDKGYLIHNLNEVKRNEIILSIGENIGFIV